MISLTFSLLSLIAFSLAQNQTASLYLPFLDGELVGSIAGGDATATTYVVQCASSGAAATTAAAATTVLIDDLGNSDSDGCGLLNPLTVVEGPSTVAYVTSGSAIDDSTLSVNCALSGTSVAVCTASLAGAILTDTSESLPSLTTATLSGTDVSYIPVVITAGSVSQAASTPTSTTASTTGAAKGGSTSSTPSSTSNAGTQTQTGSTTSASTKASGAAVHMGPVMGIGAAGALAAVAAVVL